MRFDGFGFEWDCRAYGDDWMTGGKRDDLHRIVAAMRPAIVRTMLMGRWYYRDAGVYQWDSPPMLRLVDLLTFCQRRGIAVILCEWGCEPGWLKLPGIAAVDDGRYLDAVAAAVDHLVKERGLTCIRDVTLVNEPNLEVGDFDRWARAVVGLAQRLMARGVPVRLMGADNTGAPQWLDRAAAELAGALGGYDFHRYAQREEVRSGRLGDFVRQAWERAVAADPGALGKPRVIAEAGLGSPGSGATANPLHLTDEYALHMTDYALQAVAAGSTAVLAWMLDDDSHPDFTWGMMHGWRRRHEPKPWFHAWSALTRLFPAGRTLRFDPTGVEGLRQMLCLDDAGRLDTWCIVNHTNQPRPMTPPVPPAAERWLVAAQTAAGPPARHDRPSTAAPLTCPPGAALIVGAIHEDGPAR